MCGSHGVIRDRRLLVAEQHVSAEADGSYSGEPWNEQADGPGQLHHTDGVHEPEAEASPLGAILFLQGPQQ